MTLFAWQRYTSVCPLLHTYSKQYNAPSYLFRAFCRMYDTSTDWLSYNECHHNMRSRRVIGCIVQGALSMISTKT